MATSRWVTGQNGIGQNGIRTKWYGENGSNFYRF